MTNPLFGENNSLSDTFVPIDIVPFPGGADLDVTARGVRCNPNGEAGTLRVTTLAGTVRDTYIGIGETLVLAITKIHNTGTAATSIEALI